MTTTTSETWRCVAELPGLEAHDGYEVSDRGRVRSKRRDIVTIDRGSVQLADGAGGRFRIGVPRLVLMAFVRMPVGDEVARKIARSKPPSVDNVEWRAPGVEGRFGGHGSGSNAARRLAQTVGVERAAELLEVRPERVRTWAKRGVPAPRMADVAQMLRAVQRGDVPVYDTRRDLTLDGLMSMRRAS